MRDCEVCGTPCPETMSEIYFPDKTVHFWCNSCWNKNAIRQQEERKAQLDAMPRCEFCNRRGTFIAVGQVLLCGRHLKQAQNKVAGFGIFGMGMSQTPESVRAILTKA